MGSLEIIIGPMFSGKTELLIEKCKELYPDKNVHSLAINYHKDTRYGDNTIVSHSGFWIPSTNLDSLSELLKYPFCNDIKKYTHIFINEAQFFSDLKKVVVKLVEEYNKHVVICGLDSDYKREKFGDIWELIPHADTIVKLKGKCQKCNNDSIFTHRITNETEQEVIGVTNYIPLCRGCYNSANLYLGEDMEFHKIQ